MLNKVSLGFPAASILCVCLVSAGFYKSKPGRLESYAGFHFYLLLLRRRRNDSWCEVALFKFTGVFYLLNLLDIILIPPVYFSNIAHTTEMMDWPRGMMVWIKLGMKASVVEHTATPQNTHTHTRTLRYRDKTMNFCYTSASFAQCFPSHHPHPSQ